MNTKPKVLIIDDEPDILEMVGMFLGRRGFDVTAANGSLAALDIMGANTFDIVLCDYMMPNMNGIDLLKKIRAREDLTPFVFFSGNANDQQEHQMIGLGAYQLVLKTDFGQLKEVMDKVLKQYEFSKKIGEDKNENSEVFNKLLNSSKI